MIGRCKYPFGDGLFFLAILVLGSVSEIEIQCTCLYHDAVAFIMIYLYMSIIVYLKVFRFHNCNTDLGLIRIPNVCYTLPAKKIMLQVTFVGRV